ncbi:scavenger receptor class F member 1-like [Ruditapes philippinarum]|uniref:scavenger receptor class F member 1-like n=1 Tax=Ruditapes philippinarum TaxID=129788 RepID=UPI00295B746E|nr:scavenger receptor class F member 1-like [Ruditapes philippinarum]
MICNENCLNRTCWRNGSCDQGCVAGSYGALCQLSCNKNCLHETCNRNNGFCSGCSRGWYGNTCSLQCNDVYENGTCEQDSGDCEHTITEAKALNQSENEDLFGQNRLYINVAILGSGWMMFLILLIIFIVILCKRRCAAEVVKDKESETTKTEKEIVKMKRRNQGDEYITLQMDSSEVKNSFDNSEYTGLKALEGKSQNQRRGVVSYVNLGLGLKRTG